MLRDVVVVWISEVSCGGASSIRELVGVVWLFEFVGVVLT